MQPVGSLVAGRDGILAIDVANPGSTPSGPVQAQVSAPDGVSSGPVSGDGWSGGAGAQPAVFSGHMQAVPAVAVGGARFRTAAAPAAITLTGPSLAAGASTTAYLHVHVAADATTGGRTSVTVQAGDFHTTVTTASGVQSSGLAAVYAAHGRAETVLAGNTLITCPGIVVVDCQLARHGVGLQRDNNDWPFLQPLREAGPGHGTPAADSAVGLNLPAGATVAWAQLTWSGTQCGCTSGRTGLLRQGDQGAFTPISADRVETATLHGVPTYQASANVTGLVRSGGRWWFGLPDRPDTAAGSYAGWSLVVVVTAPDLPVHTVAVLDSDTPVQQGSSVTADIDGLDGGSGQAGIVAWEGDRNLPGASVSIDGSALQPDCGCDLLGSSADGAMDLRGDTGGDWNTFGTDVHTVPVHLAATEPHRLVATAGPNAFLLGVLALTLP